MKIATMIAISSNAGIVKAGLKQFKEFLEGNEPMKNEMNVTDEDMKTILSTIEVFTKIRKNVMAKID